MKFLVRYCLQKDINNYLNSVWRFTYQKWGRIGIQQRFLKYYPIEFQQELKKAKTKVQAQEVIKNFLTSKSDAFHNMTKIRVEEITDLLNKNSKKIIFRLEKIYKQPFPFEKIIVYLTTAPIFPYNYEKRWFMTGRNCLDEKHLAIATHELNHFMFYYYYKNLDLVKEKSEILKEALAILSNVEENNKPNIKVVEKFVFKHKTKPVDEIVGLVLNSGLL